MRIDFFVHPEHAIKTGFSNKTLYNRYLAELYEIYKNSDLPILIAGNEKGEFDELFSLEERLQSSSHFIMDFPIDRGEIRPSEWERYTEIVVQGTEFRVHGSYFGECTEGFATQLFGYSFCNEHWYNWMGHIPKEFIDIQKKKLKFHEKKGNYSYSNIRYGTVLTPPKPPKIIKRSFLSKMFGKPHGNITFQLMDSQTKLYR